MNRTFIHTFEPPEASPIAGDIVHLDVSDIENAGIREVLQTPGVAYGAWSILDALLQPTGAGTPFVFREPLGQSREVKVAMSGLFGRFIARAYLERYLNLSVFAHLGNRDIDIDGRLQVRIVRRDRGDLPDWIACDSGLSPLWVAEAKGCHDVGGPQRALHRAWDQARRIDVRVGDRVATVRRIAVATRWGVAQGQPSSPHISIRDPEDKGDPISPEEEMVISIGILRLHISNLIRSLGHSRLSDALIQVNRSKTEREKQISVGEARKLLDGSPVKEFGAAESAGKLLGGIVVRTGPIDDRRISRSDEDVLDRLNLRPVFVGVERNFIDAAIQADFQAVRHRLKAAVASDEFARPDPAGGWIIRLGARPGIAGGS